MSSPSKSLSKMERAQTLEYTGVFNRLLAEIDSDWRLGMITKAWPEDMEGEKTGGIGMLIWVLKSPIRINGEKQDVWVVHPKSHAAYCKACGNPVGRWPMVLNEALTIVGVK